MVCAFWSGVVFLIVTLVDVTYADTGPFMSEMIFHTAYISTNCARYIKVSYAQCVKTFAESENDVMNFWRLATLCELCPTAAINDTSAKGRVNDTAIGSLMRYKYFIGSSNESLSTHKRAEQSTEFVPHPASLAVDGNPNSVDLSCTHTTGQPDDWWMVDLGRVFQVTTVNIINRIDCSKCGDRLDGIIYEVGITSDSWAECGRFDGPGSNRLEINIRCHRAIHGRYVRIRKYKKNALSLCEVYVYS